MRFRKESSKFVKYRVGIKPIKYSVFDIAKGQPDSKLKNIHEYATLCHNVYCDETYSDNWNNQKSRVNLQGWIHLKDFSDYPQSPDGRKILAGLYYEVWEKHSLEDEITYAIVFRGTEDGTDWKANFRWFSTKIFPYWWDQYHQVQYFIDELVDELIKRAKRQNKKFKIISTGHSLGGGLAQLSAYASNNINLAFTFHSSPVTGYYDLSYVLRTKNKKDTTIYRIYEKGEFLAYIRNFMLFIYPAPLIKTKNPRLIRIRYDLLGQHGMASQHSIWSFAEWLSFINKKSTEAI